ncbi:MAG TPA: S8 family serine peptidase [Burkholderiaceae bacterium]|nr:S8 family serine peptidase [Burkholderiaceae bacterium]
MVHKHSGLVRSALAAAIAAAALAAPLAAQAAPKQERMVLVYKAGAGAAAKDAVAKAGGKVVLDLAEVNAMAVRLTAAARDALKANPNVEMIEADPVRHVMGGPTGKRPVRAMGASGETVPYGITMVQADQLTFQAANAKKLCIVDSGYDISHEDLPPSNVAGVDLTNSGIGSWNTDEASHGTHVAGTIAALGGNGKGVVGVIPTGQQPLFISKVFDASGSASSSTIIKGVLQCNRNKAKIISMSLGGGRPTKFEQNIYDNMAAKGILVIASAGNGGTSDINYPAGYPSVMSVAAIDSSKVKAGFSQFNADVEIAGPGVAVLSTVPLGSQIAASTAVGGTPFTVQPMDGSPLTSATGPLADFGFGDTPAPGTMTGKICLISRGNIAFSDKVLNCTTSGGIGAIIYNNTTGDLFGTLGDVATTIPSVGATQADGATMLATKLGQSSTVAVFPSDAMYAEYSGTSMSAPHVSGVAALVWSNHPSCTAAQLRESLKKSAMDLGAVGRDDEYGAGLVQAKAASDRIASLGCGN